MYDFLVVGAGLAGCVVAERLARILNKKILIIDKRPHIGGNVFDSYDENGILFHNYGPHIFHTDSQRVIDYVSMFADWREYIHQVKSYVRGKYLPFPININTINELYGINLINADEMKKFLDSRSKKKKIISSMEDYFLNNIGDDLYNLFIRNYSIKQWGLDPSEISYSVAKRIPIRCDFNNNYFTDKFQGIPANGYSELFKNLLDSSNIDISLETEYKNLSKNICFTNLIFTGPIDSFFNFGFGKLQYRSLEFKKIHHSQNFIQDVAVINYPNNYDFTRSTEFKHITGQDKKGTTIMYEYPCDDINEPYYPVINERNSEIKQKYIRLSKKSPNTFFIGRLGKFSYMNMDEVVLDSLFLFEKIRGESKYD